MYSSFETSNFTVLNLSLPFICIRIDQSSAHVNFDVFTSKRTLGQVYLTHRRVRELPLKNRARVDIKTRKLLRSHKGNWDRNYELIHKVFIKNFSSVS